MNQRFDIAVIGGGMSGLIAAQQCAERGATVVCIDESVVPGGLDANIGKLDNFPTGAPISGGALAEAVIRECKTLDVAFLNARAALLESSTTATAIGFDASASKTAPVTATVVIVASGARLRSLGVPGEAELTGRGVSQCDWCDGGFFRNQPVAVIGGGDAAYQAAIHLAATCESVTVLMRGSDIRARRAYVQTAADNERIAFRWDTVVERVIGSDRVEALMLRNTAENAEESLPVDGVFVFVGTRPNSEFLPATVERDEAGLVITDGAYRTSLPGIFAVGAVRKGYSGQLLSACGEAAAVAPIAMAEVERRTS